MAASSKDLDNTILKFNYCSNRNNYFAITQPLNSVNISVNKQALTEIAVKWIFQSNYNKRLKLALTQNTAAMLLRNLTFRNSRFVQEPNNWNRLNNI